MFTTKNLLILIGRHAIITILAIITAASSVWILSQQITRLSEDVQKNRSLASMLEKRMELFASVKRDTELVGTNDVLIERAFVPLNNILDFVAMLEGLALKNGVTQAFHFENPVPSTIPIPFPLAMVPYSNSLNGNLASFSNYLKDFERLHYFTKIENLSISTQSKTGWRDAGTMSFQANIQTNATQ